MDILERMKGFGVSTTTPNWIRPEIIAARAEMERLAGTIRAWMTIWRVDVKAKNAEIERLKAHNAELVGALQEYVRDFGDNEDSDSQLMVEKARAAIAKASK